MRLLLAFATEQDALDFQAATNAAFGMPLADGITVRYADVTFDYASGTWIHLLDDAMAAKGITAPPTATVVADEAAVRLQPTELETALADSGLDPVNVVQVATNTLQAITTTLSAQPVQQVLL
jgi:hypothetical protein